MSMNWGEIKTTMSGMLNRRDMTAALQNGFMQQGVARIQRELRCPAMEAVSAVEIENGVNFKVGTGIGLAVPSNYLQLIKLSAYDVDGTFQGDLDLVNTNTAKFRAITRGAIPKVYAREGSQWVLGPEPGDGITVRIHYYTELEDLTDDTDTSTLSDIAPDLFIFGGLIYAGLKYKDVRTTDWIEAFKDIKQSVQDQADRDELTNAVVEPGLAWPSDE